MVHHHIRTVRVRGHTIRVVERVRIEAAKHHPWWVVASVTPVEVRFRRGGEDVTVDIEALNIETEAPEPAAPTRGTLSAP